MGEIHTQGGPLLVLPEDALELWYGAYGPHGEEDWPEDETDYWEVSEQITDYADVVDVRGVPALALANGRSPTHWFDHERLFVQRLATSAESNAIAAAPRLLKNVQWQHHTDWTVNAHCVVIDSAKFGPAINPGDLLRIELKPARYLVRSAYLALTSDDTVTVALTQLMPRLYS